MKLIFTPWYFFIALFIFVVEVLIALFVNDSYVRPYVGDALVVILMYCFLKSFIKIPFWQAAIAVLIFSIFVETLQYFKIVQLLGWEENPLARTVLGTSFDWHDILMYSVGITIVLVVEIFRKK